jgi:hypothetical protein
MPAAATADDGMNAAERAELHRQGAKAAARGEATGSNPLRDPVNRPCATGEAPAVWLLRLQAWDSGFENQGLPLRGRLAEPAA